jgi:hypothetical protein
MQVAVRLLQPAQWMRLQLLPPLLSLPPPLPAHPHLLLLSFMNSLCPAAPTQTQAALYSCLLLNHLHLSSCSHCANTHVCCIQCAACVPPPHTLLLLRLATPAYC